MYVQDSSFKFLQKSDEEFVNESNLSDNFVIALDFDGVVTNPYALKTQYINEFGYDITEEQCAYDSCIRKLGVKEDHYKTALEKSFLEDPTKLPIEEGFMTAMNRFKQLKDCVVILVSSRMDRMIEHMQDYLREKGIRVDGIFNTNMGGKLEVLQMIHANVFVEDSPFKLKQIFDEMDDSNRNFFNSCKFVLYRNKQNLVEESPNELISEMDSWSKLSGFIREEYITVKG